jgi:glucose-6-phosphate 1-dehydrogenase
VKKPGAKMIGEAAELIVHEDPARGLPPYARLLGDAMRGDHTLFISDACVEAAWRVVDPVLRQSTPVHPYAAGSWGPPAAQRLLRAPGSWHNPKSRSISTGKRKRKPNAARSSP